LSKLNERIALYVTEWEYKSGQKKRQTVLSNIGSYDADNRRQFIFGELSMMFFDKYPLFQQLQPKHSEAENHAEFARVEAFYALLADEKEVMERLIKKLTEAFEAEGSL
jgi:hypothetical protein